MSSFLNDSIIQNFLNEVNIDNISRDEFYLLSTIYSHIIISLLYNSNSLSSLKSNVEKIIHTNKNFSTSRPCSVHYKLLKTKVNNSLSKCSILNCESFDILTSNIFTHIPSIKNIRIFNSNGSFKFYLFNASQYIFKLYLKYVLKFFSIKASSNKLTSEDIIMSWAIYVNLHKLLLLPSKYINTIVDIQTISSNYKNLYLENIPTKPISFFEKIDDMLTIPILTEDTLFSNISLPTVQITPEPISQVSTEMSSESESQLSTETPSQSVTETESTETESTETESTETESTETESTETESTETTALSIPLHPSPVESDTELTLVSPTESNTTTTPINTPLPGSPTESNTTTTPINTPLPGSPTESDTETTALSIPLPPSPIESSTESETETETISGSESETVSSSETESETVTGSETETESGSETESETVTGSETETETESETESESSSTKDELELSDVNLSDLEDLEQEIEQLNKQEQLKNMMKNYNKILDYINEYQKTSKQQNIINDVDIIVNSLIEKYKDLDKVTYEDFKTTMDNMILTDIKNESDIESETETESEKKTDKLTIKTDVFDFSKNINKNGINLDSEYSASSSESDSESDSESGSESDIESDSDSESVSSSSVDSPIKRRPKLNKKQIQKRRIKQRELKAERDAVFRNLYKIKSP